jgi:hypothetical protein
MAASTLRPCAIGHANELSIGRRPIGEGARGLLSYSALAPRDDRQWSLIAYDGR